MGNSGILMHISSLPSPYGIGNLGEEAFEFVDFLKKTGQEYWQILPQNPTGFGDSPYQSSSAFAGNPYFVDIDTLVDEGLLEKEEVDNYFFGDNPEKIDYEKLFFYRYPLLRCAFFRFEADAEYEKFVLENAFWLDEYALFMALKEQNHYQSWLEWDEKLKNRDKELLDELIVEIYINSYIATEKYRKYNLGIKLSAIGLLTFLLVLMIGQSVY